MAISGQSTALFAGDTDLTTFFKDLEVGKSAKELNTTTFGGDAATGDESFMPGLKTGKFSTSGYWHQGTGAVDTTSLDYKLSSIFGVASQPYSVGWQGTTIGNRAAFFGGFESNWSIGAEVGGLAAVDIDVKMGDGAVYFGFWHANKTARSTGTNVDLASVDWGAASTTSNGFAAVIHRTAQTGASATSVKIQDSSDNVTFADVSGAAFTNFTTTGAELITGTTAVRRYTRVRYTVGSGVTNTWVVALAKL